MPRRKSSNYGEESFQRNTPARRSAGYADKCVEYFVPRSLSEFNLSGAAGELYELAAFSDRSRAPDRPPALAPTAGPGGVGGGAGPGAAAAGAAGKARDKMVTFEDDRPGKLLADDVFM